MLDNGGSGGGGGGASDERQGSGGGDAGTQGTAGSGDEGEDPEQLPPKARGRRRQAPPLPTQDGPQASFQLRRGGQGAGCFQLDPADVANAHCPFQPLAPAPEVALPPPQRGRCCQQVQEQAQQAQEPAQEVQQHGMEPEGQGRSQQPREQQTLPPPAVPCGSHAADAAAEGRDQSADGGGAGSGVAAGGNRCHSGGKRARATAEADASGDAAEAELQQRSPEVRHFAAQGWVFLCMHAVRVLAVAAGAAPRSRAHAALGCWQRAGCWG